MAAHDLTAARLRELLHYDHETGIFIWLPKPQSAFSKSRHHKAAYTRYAGKIAGSLKKRGYCYIKIDGVMYGAHRLAWLYVHGCWPLNQIDHMNRQRADNRISNLRDVTPSINAQNTTGTGVTFDRRKKKWMAQISDQGRSKFLGRFDSRDEAEAAYKDGKRRLHPGFIDRTII